MPPFNVDYRGRFENAFCPDGSSCEMINAQLWKCRLFSALIEPVFHDESISEV